MNGDSLFDINLLDLAAAPLAPGIVGRIALLREHAGRRYGRVEIADDLVAAFQAPSEAASGPINAGIYVFDRSILDLVKTTPSSLESDVLPVLARQRSLEARIYDRFFIDIGVPEDLRRADNELPAALMRPAIFLDRDGVLNKDLGYVHRPEQIVWTDGVTEAVKACNDAGAFVFVISNQAGVARGYYDEAAVNALHRWMNRELAAAGAHVDAFEYCPHHEEASVAHYRRSCRRRKPEPGMILDLLEAWTVERANSILIGDKASDIAAGEAAGIRSFLFPGGNLHDFLIPLLAQPGARHLQNRATPRSEPLAGEQARNG